MKPTTASGVLTPDCISCWSRYILDNETKFELTQATSSTRESVLTSDHVDAVFATYSITPSRQEVISFAGPYYTSQYAVLVKNSNTEITGIDGLADKIVATQAGSTGPSILEQFAPDAIVQEFEDDIQVRTAVELGRADEPGLAGFPNLSSSRGRSGVI